MTDTFISAQDLINAKEISEFSVTRAQLVRWQNRGAIPRPVLRHLGKGHGTVALYPLSVIEQTKALYARLKVKRSLDQAVLDLWLKGFTVDVHVMARRLLRKYTHMVEGQREKKDGYYYLNETAWKTINDYSDYKKKRFPPSLVLGQVRGRIRRNDFERVMFVALTMLTQSSEGWEEEDINSLLKAAGLELSQPFIEKVKKGEFENDLHQMSGYQTAENLISVLDNTPDDILKAIYCYLKVVINAIRLELPAFKNIKEFQDWDAYSQMSLTLGFVSCLKLFMPMMELIASMSATDLEKGDQP